MQGRVAVLRAYGGDFELRDYPVPDPEPGALLVKLTRAGICGSDLHITICTLVPALWSPLPPEGDLSGGEGLFPAH